jgi:hypothetical protein
MYSSNVRCSGLGESISLAVAVRMLCVVAGYLTGSLTNTYFSQLTRCIVLHAGSSF